MAALVWKLISLRLITSDDEYSLFGVVVFRRVKDEFTQKCRENKWVFFIDTNHSVVELACPGSWFVTLRIRMNKHRSSKTISIWPERRRRSYGSVPLVYSKLGCIDAVNIRPNSYGSLATNFSEAMQILVHLKVVELFVESVLRYGLPAEYTGLVVR